MTLANPLPRLRVSRANPHALETEDGAPFFLLGDTAWELFHRLTRAESERYFSNRAAKGFNVICAVALSEFDGLRTPNAEGEVPLLSNDPRRPNEAYFALVDAQIAQAAAHGLYVGLLPTWGDKLTAPWGDGPCVFPTHDPDAAHAYGLWLGRRYRETANLLWVLGGDRPARRPDGPDWTALWRAMAAGVLEGTEGQALLTYHPQGGRPTTSALLHDEPWLHVNAMQSGHGSGHDVPVWDWVAHDYALLPPKPTLDAEPNYEDHPVNPWPVYDPANGYFRADDVRRQCYRSVFAGGCGVIYGHHSVWQFWDDVREKINHADRVWTEALDRPGAFQVGYLRRLIESRPFLHRVPAPAFLAGNIGAGRTRAVATGAADGSYALVYIPIADQTVTVALSQLTGPRIRAAWFNPRTGEAAAEIGTFLAQDAQAFTTPPADSDEEGDWVLTLDSLD